MVKVETCCSILTVGWVLEGNRALLFLLCPVFTVISHRQRCSFSPGRFFCISWVASPRLVNRFASAEGEVTNDRLTKRGEATREMQKNRPGVERALLKFGESEKKN